MGLTSRATLIPPAAGVRGEVPVRKTRCRMTDRNRNPCANEALSDFGLCARHLAASASEFRRITEQAQRC